MKSVLSILIALVFLAGQVGFTLSTHYCGGKIFEQSLGVIHSDLSCGMEGESTTICENNGTAVKDNCCHDEFQSLALVNEFKTQVDEINISEYLALVFTLSFFELLSFDPPSFSEELNISPPLLERDIPVLIQSFLI